MNNMIKVIGKKIHLFTSQIRQLSIPLLFCGSTLLTVHSELAIAQTPVSGFENWGVLSNSTYDSILFTYYGIPNAMNGQPSDWATYYGAYTPNIPLLPSINYFGVLKADGAQAASGSSAIILHTWYFYGRSTITWEDTISSAPVSITGRYKRITEITVNDTLHDGFSKGYAYILSTTNDTLYRGEITLTDTNVWTLFQMNLQPYTTSSSPIERIFIAFVNDSNVRTCVEQGVCDLLWLDEIELNMGTTSVDAINSQPTGFLPTPNPASDIVQIRQQENSEAASFMITDNSGRIIQNGQLNAGESTVSIAHLPTGVYQIRLTTENSVFNQRVIKQ